MLAGIPGCSRWFKTTFRGRNIHLGFQVQSPTSDQATTNVCYPPLYTVSFRPKNPHETSHVVGQWQTRLSYKTSSLSNVVKDWSDWYHPTGSRHKPVFVIVFTSFNVTGQTTYVLAH